MKRFLILLVAVGMMSGPALAQPQESENFLITKSVLDAGGALSTSANFRLVSAFGQPTPIGLQWSENFVLSAGFLSPLFSVSPLSPIQDLVIKREPGLSSNVKLDWSAVPNADTYTIYRDANPLFTPGPGNLRGTSATNSFVDVGAIPEGLKFYYIVTSSAEGGGVVAKDPGKTMIKTQPSRVGSQ